MPGEKKKADGKPSRAAGGKKAPKKAARKAPSPPAPAPVEEEQASAPSLPSFVREASPAERKAAVEQLAADAGIAPILARAPWRRRADPAAADAATAVDAAAPAARRQMPSKSPAPEPEARVGVTGAKPVILDSNALMMQFQFHIDVEKELKRLLEFKHEIVVPSIVVDELKALAEETVGKDAGEARMALQLASTFKIVDAPGEGDTGILRLAEKMNALVVTNDKILRARLRAKDVPNIYMRKSAFLTLEGHVAGV